MQIIENEVVSGKTLAIDEKHFVNCRYNNCTLIYTGGEFTTANTVFENCHLSLAGAAQRTAALLGSFGILPPPNGPKEGGPQFGFTKKSDGKVH